MKIYSIYPISGKYFEDKSEYANITDNMYQGTYNYTPIYPLYTFLTNNRFNYMSPNPEIQFFTMLPIKKLLSNYLVEIRFRFKLNVFEKNSLNIAINEFNNFCEINKKELNVNALPF